MQASTATSTPSQTPDTSSVSTLAHSRLSPVSDPESSTPPWNPKHYRIPPVSTFTHNFLGKPKLLAGKQHINKPVTSKGDLGGHSEFRGRGPPSPDIGQVGDVYWDTTDSVFYARYEGGGSSGDLNPSTDPWFASVRPAVGSDGSGQWRAWRDDPSNPQRLIKHPLYDDRFLWFGGHSGGVGWFASRRYR